MNECVNEHVNECLNECLNESMNESMSGQFLSVTYFKGKGTVSTLLKSNYIKKQAV